MAWYSHLFKDYSQFVVIHTVKGFGIANKAKVDVLLELSCFFDHPADIGNLISGSSAFSKSSLNIWMFMINILLKTGLKNFKRYFASVREKCYMRYFEHSLSLPFFEIGIMKTYLLQSYGQAEFSRFAGILSAALAQHHLLGFEIAQLEFHHLH